MGTIQTCKGRTGEISYHRAVRRKGYAPVYETFTRLTDAKRWIQDVESNMHAGVKPKTFA